MAEAKRLKVAWISDFPIEWLPDLPEPLKHLPKPHSMSWQRVLLEEFEKTRSLDLHIYAVRRSIGSHHFERNGVSFHVVNVSIPRAQTFYWWDTWVLRRYLRKLQPDIVHAWGTERGAAIIADRLKFPYLITIQGLMTWYMEIMKLNFHEKLATHYEKKCVPRSPLVTTESTFAVGFLKERFPGVRVHQAEHAPNWLFHRVKRQPQTAPVRFVFVGGASYRKGADLLFAGLERLVDEFPFELILVGRVDLRFQEVLSNVKESRLWKQMTMKESLTAAEVAEEFSRATMLLFPTRADTSPNTVKEAVVAGLPVVASAVGGITDYVFPGSNGFLFPSEDIEAFTERIREAVKHPIFGKGQVEPETLTRVRDYLSPERMARLFQEAYAKVLGVE